MVKLISKIAKWAIVIELVGICYKPLAVVAAYTLIMLGLQTLINKQKLTNATKVVSFFNKVHLVKEYDGTKVVFVTPLPICRKILLWLMSDSFLPLWAQKKYEALKAEALAAANSEVAEDNK